MTFHSGFCIKRSLPYVDMLIDVFVWVHHLEEPTGTYQTLPDLFEDRWRLLQGPLHDRLPFASASAVLLQLPACAAWPSASSLPDLRCSSRALPETYQIFPASTWALEP